MLRRIVVLTVIAIAVQAATPQTSEAAPIWGGFDTTRVNYPGGTLTGTAHDTLEGIIIAGGGAIGALAPTLTAAYLGGVDVFYTSLLSMTTGTLAASEQLALGDWVAGGGTLIVTADIFPLPAYESFTSQFGVTGYSSVGGCGASGVPVAAHAITAGVTSYAYCTESTFSYGADALRLGNNVGGAAFMAVLEASTGFALAGRVLVLGDHNMFTESYIGSSDNTLLANNIVDWAGRRTAVPEPTSLLLLGIGSAGLIAKSRRRRNSQR